MCVEINLHPYAGHCPAENDSDKRTRVSAFIIAFNEEDRISRALASLHGLVDEIIVVDSGSTDRTSEIAIEHGARVVINSPFPGYGPQKRFAEDLCQHTWVLNIDADEELTQELRASINSAVIHGQPAVGAFKTKIVEILPGEVAPPSFSYSVSPIRLYRKDYYRYSPSLVHDRIEFPKSAKAGNLDGIILHRSIKSFSEQLEKLSRYSALQATDAKLSGRTVPIWRIFFEFPVSFIKIYFFRRYFMRGTLGFLASMNYAIFRFLRIMRMHESQRVSKRTKHQSY
jgi:glycosyltransferase involved in cell wall biosynthesis